MKSRHGQGEALLEAVLAGAGRLFPRAPVRFVEFRDVTEESLRAVADVPQLNRLTELVLKLGGMGVCPTAITALLASPHLGHLFRLAVWSVRYCGTELARAVAMCPALRDLSVRYLMFTRISAEGAQILAGSPNLKHLTTLNLCENHIGDGGPEPCSARDTWGACASWH
jgi:hypothetical protein